MPSMRPLRFRCEPCEDAVAVAHDGARCILHGVESRSDSPAVPAIEDELAPTDGKPIHTQLRCVPGFTKEAITAYASANIAPGTRVLSDGLACFGGVVEAGMKHTAIVTGGGRPKDQRLKWTNTGLANIKGAITGTCRSCDPQHTERYLAAYEC